jgi:hypothetical protein
MPLVIGKTLGRDGLDHVPMLDDHAVFHPEQVVEGVGRAVPLAFADGQDKIALAQHRVDLGVLEHVALRRQLLDGRDDPLKPVRDIGLCWA